MAELVLAFAGFGATAFNNAEDLIMDFINDRPVTAYVSDGEGKPAPGMEQVEKVLREARIPFSIITVEDLVPALEKTEGRSYLIVMGTESIYDIIRDAANRGIPVLDLCEGLDDISWAFGAVRSEPSVKPDPMIKLEDMNMASMTDEEIKKFVIGIVRAHEEGFHYEQHNHVVPQVQAREPEKKAEGSIRYYENGHGKFRKAGRSKIKPGEVEVFLTKEEADELETTKAN